MNGEGPAGDDLLPRDGDLVDQLYEGVYYVDRERTLTFWNRGAERITGFDRSCVVGRHCYDNILGHVDEQGRSLCHSTCPLLATILDGEPREARVYLHHSDGHRQPVRVRTAPIRDRDGSVIGGIEVFHDDADLIAVRERMEELQRLAVLDPLTGVGNRRYGDIQLRARLADLRRQSWPFGLLFIDIDHFKQVNDRYGHDIGDDVLKTVAHTLAYSGRASDIVVRWGGEELLVIVSVADAPNLLACAERLRALVQQSALEYRGEPVSVTVSVGATMARADDTVEKLVGRADHLMYRSKADGRDRVTIDADPDTQSGDHAAPGCDH